MRVKATQNVRVLGTNLTLTEGKDYKAIHATNQPDWEAKGLVFVNPDQKRDSILCTIGDEVELMQ